MPAHISTLFFGFTAFALCRDDSMDLSDRYRAELLLKEVRSESSPLASNKEYVKIVSVLSKHHQLTKKDLENMIDFERVHDIDHYLKDGHINER